MENFPLYNHLQSLNYPIEGPIRPQEQPQHPGSTPGETAESFTDLLRNQIAQVNQLQLNADNAIQALALGQTQDIHSTLIAVQKANISFQLMMAVRNRLLEAYEEVMRMQI